MTALCLAGSGGTTTSSGCGGGSGLRGRRLHTTTASPLRQLPCSRTVPAGTSRSCVRVLAFRWGSGNNSDNKSSEAAGGASTQPPQPPAAAESQPSESDSIRDIDAMLGKAPKLAGFDDVAEGADDPPGGAGGGGSGSEAERAEEVRVRRQEAFREVLRPPPSGYREPTDELMAQARAEADAQQQQQLATNALNALGDSSSSSSSGGGGAHRLLAALEGDPRTRGVGRAAGRSVQGLQRWWAGVPDKRLVVAEAAALAVAAYLGSAVLGAVDRAPLLPQAFQAVGLAYSSWFWWRFVLFARGRQELRQLLGRAQAAVAESVSDLAEAADSAAAAAAAGKDVFASTTSTAESDEDEEFDGGGGSGGSGGGGGGGWRTRGGAAVNAAGAAARAAATTARGVVESIAARHHQRWNQHHHHHTQRHTQQHHQHQNRGRFHLLHSRSRPERGSSNDGGGGGGSPQEQQQQQVQDQQQQQQQQQRSADAAAAAAVARAAAQRREAEADSTQAYVEGLLQELDERQARLHTQDQGGEEEEKQEGEEGAAAPPTTTPWASSGTEEQRRRGGSGGGGSGRGGPPAVFALRLLSAAVAAGGGDGAGVLMARQRGPEEVEGMNGIPDPSASASSGSSSSDPPQQQSTDPPQQQSPASDPPPQMGLDPPQQSPASDPPPQMGLDPCLGWDTEACAATGHMQLEAPDMAKLEALAEEAARQARAATGFSRHVDQALHAPGRSRSASMEEEDLEGQYGRAAGALERQEMEQMAKQPHAAMPHPRSKRQPAQGEETGTGPQR